MSKRTSQGILFYGSFLLMLGFGVLIAVYIVLFKQMTFAMPSTHNSLVVIYPSLKSLLFLKPIYSDYYTMFILPAVSVVFMGALTLCRRLRFLLLVLASYHGIYRAWRFAIYLRMFLFVNPLALPLVIAELLLALFFIKLFFLLIHPSIREQF